jgi:hypothetical protein
MTSLNISNNLLVQIIGWRYGGRSESWKFYHSDGRKQNHKPEEEMGKPDLSGAIALADAIPDMGALSSVNLLKNNIPVEQAQELVKIMQSMEKLTTLCGLSKEEIKLNFSSQNLGAGDAVLIANDISDMGVLTSLDISGNNLARGAYNRGEPYLDTSYAIDTTGMCVCVAPKLFSDAMLLQVLLPLPMPSPV